MRWGITGGSGSMGSALIAELIQCGRGPIITMSRDEVKTHFINRKYGGLGGEVRVHTIPSGISDIDRLIQIFRGCDVLIHCAATKRIDQFTYGSSEAMLETNIFGTRNIIRVATECGIKKLLIISSDKASSPINSYGVSKAMVEHLAVEANSYSVPCGTHISVARFGNCMGSRGSVLHVWREQIKNGGPIQLTDPSMTRFWLSLSESISWIFKWVDMMRGGEIFLPVLPSAKLIDLATALDPDMPLKIIGKRKGGEKLHEQLLNEEEPSRTLKRGGFYIVCPSVRSWSLESYMGTPVDNEMIYRSDLNDWWLSIDELKKLVEEI